jgi:hypothetical protein
MLPLHYVIFHPDYARERLIIRGRAIRHNYIENWQGPVWVDADDGGNEDPFVLSDRWIYSYCHATQLRRKPSLKFPYVTTGSYLFFCSGDAANRGVLQVDTVFLIDTVAEWPEHKELPNLYVSHFENRQSDLWNRHFQFAFLPEHHEGRYTYVAKNWTPNSEDYSFLPLNKCGNRVSIRFNKLSADLRWSIQSKLHGKRPVVLNENQKDEIRAAIVQAAFTKVVKIQTRRAPAIASNTLC